MVSSEGDQRQARICSLQDIGGHFMKVPIVVFQVLLCMHLEVHDDMLNCVLSRPRKILVYLEI